MGLFILLSMITLYLYPSTSGYNEVNVAVNIAYAAFFLFCLIMGYHIHTSLKTLAWYGKATEAMMAKSKINNWKASQNFSLSTIANNLDNESDPNTKYTYLRESFLEHL